MMENELPEGWIETTLGDIIKVSSGDGLISNNMNKDGGIPVFGGNGITGFHDKANIDEETIVIGRVGFYCGSVHLTPKKAWVTDNALKVFYSEKSLDKRFLYWLLKSLNLGQYSGSSAQPVVSGSKLYQVPIPLPPFAEQKRIVAKLDAAYAHLDTLKASLNRIPELLKKFRQTVLTQAVTGKLTESWREGKSFYIDKEVNFIKEMRVERYKVELEKAIIQDSKKPRKVNFEECKEESSIKGWKTLFIEEIFDIETGGTPKRDVKKYWDNGTIPWVKSGQVSNGDIIEADEFVTETSLIDTNVKLYPYNSILIAMYGEGKTRGQVGILKFEATSNQAIAAMINPSLPETTIKFVFYFGLSQYEEIRKEAAGGNQPNLNTSKIRQWKIDFPPLEEQQEIVKQVEALFSTADALEAQYRSLKAKIDALMQALLAKAFRGELVPQDPANEPASVLLAKIKAAQAGVGKKRAGQTALVFMDE